MPKILTQGASSFKAQSTFSCFHRKNFYWMNERDTDHYPNLLLNKKYLIKIDLGLELARLKGLQIEGGELLNGFHSHTHP